MAVAPPTVLTRFRASAVEEAAVLVPVTDVEGLVAVREVVVEEAGRVVGVALEVDSLLTGLLADVAVRDAAVEVVVFRSKLDPATLDLRSTVAEVFGGARVDVVPAIDMRFAVPEIPRFSSPELATDLGFSSAELLTDGRERCDEVVEVLKGFRVAVVVVDGRVGGLLSELEDVVPRAVEVAVLDAVVEDEVGRLVVVELDTGRLEVAVALVVVLAGDAGVFSLEASGLDFSTSSLPDSIVESTGVAGGGAFSTSASAGGDMGSSVDAILID